MHDAVAGRGPADRDLVAGAVALEEAPRAPAATARPGPRVGALGPVSPLLLEQQLAHHALQAHAQQDGLQ